MNRKSVLTKLLPLGLAISLMLLTCGDDESPSSTNHTPAKPEINVPTGSPGNGETDVSLSPTLSWICHDEDLPDDTLTFTVHFGQSSTPPVVSSDQTEHFYTPESSLQPGTRYYWRVVAEDCAGASNSSDLWHFTTIADQTPHLAVTPASLSFTAVQNGAPPGTQTLTISNGGGGTLDWSVSYDADWLDVNPASGSGNGASITVSVNTTDLAPSTNTGTITVFSSNADNSPQTVAIEYTVTPAAELCVSPASWSAPAGGATSANISVTNCGNSETIAYTVHSSEDWLTESQSTGQTPGEFTITAAANPSPSASRTGRVIVSSSHHADTVLVTQAPSPLDPHIVVSPTSLSFGAVQGGSLPASQSFTISNSGDGTLNWTVSDDAAWLDVNPTSGSSNNATVTVSVNTTSLSPNTYTASITVASNNADNSPQTVAISYSVTAPADDGFEPNDTRSANNPLLSEDTWYHNLVQCDDDWYRIEVTSGYQRVLVDCQFSHAEGDIDIQLVNSSGNVLATSNSTTSDELIDFVVPSGGTYYLRVYFGDNCNDYSLWWDDLWHCVDDGFEPNDSRSTNNPLLSEDTWYHDLVQADDDWYRIEVTSGYQRVLVDCQFSHAEGDIDIQLVNSSGTVLISSSSITDDEYIDFVVPSGGTYYLRVHYGDNCNDYSLWWDDIWHCVDDGFEPNDSRSTNNPLLSEDTWYHDLVQADEDWYRIEVTSGYQRVLVDCQFSHAEGDIDIQLVNSSGSVLATSNSTTNDELIDFIVPSGGTYYLRVFYGDNCNDYSLWWDDLRPCVDDGFEPNDSRSTNNPLLTEDTWYNNLVQADDDWYRIAVTPGYRRILIDCRFTHSEGDVDIRLVDGTGTVLARSISTTDDEYIDFCVPSGGTYYIRVYRGDNCSDYSLWWDDVRGCDDGFEPNDSRSTDNPLLTEDTWYRGLVQCDDDWYRIAVTSGYQRVVVNCQFSHAAGDIDIQLVNSSGNVLAVSNSIDDDEYIDFVVPSGGTYYLRVHYGDGCNFYSLWWDDLQ